jgi:hypothetical protein
MELEEMLALARTWPMSVEELEAQRRSFAYGNTKIENEQITWEMVEQEAERLARGGSAT